MTKQLVELHGGALLVDSELGEGSTFTFDVARGELSDAAFDAASDRLATAPSIARLASADVPDDTVATASSRNQGLRVLVVDDEVVNRELLAQHLGSKGFDVIHARDGEEAIARIEADRPDLVLLDVMMPKKTGYDVLEAVRTKRDAAELPVLLLTAMAQESDLRHGFSLGASDYLAKPVSFVELDARLGHQARLVRALRSLAAELEERRHLQGELDRTAQQLTQSENMATLGMLMAGIAHDLRNPLNYVQAASERLRESLAELGSDDERTRAKPLPLVETVLGWIEQGTASMDAISAAMRNQARSAGAGEEDLRAMGVAEVVDEALLLCRSRTKLCALEVDVQDATILADPTALGQLVMNLVSNAADAIAEARAKTPDASARIRVQARVEVEEFVIAIEDSGPGIPEGLRARILEPFFTTKPRGQGTGLGLAIVQRVVKQHRGTLEVGRSDELGGARFAVRWPVM